MSSHATVSSGSASRWGPLWGARPDGSYRLENEYHYLTARA